MSRFKYTVELHEAVWEMGGLLIQRQHWFNTYEDALIRYKSIQANTRNCGKIVILNEIIYDLINKNNKIYEHSIFSALIT